MKIEIRCENCASCYLLDESALQGELCCPACSRSISPPSAVGSNRTSAVAAPAATARVASAPAAVEHDEEEIVCPRCKLHFKAHGSSRSVESAARRTILIVEDMSYFQEIAQDALSAHFEVKTAASVDEAQAILHDGGVDLMILDLTLEGGEEGRKLLPGQGLKRCPILIYTAQDESEMYGERWDELQRLGADDIVIKGMHVGESLVRKVGALLGIDVDAEEAIG